MLRCGPASAAAVEFPGDREQVTGAVEVDGRGLREESISCAIMGVT